MHLRSEADPFARAREAAAESEALTLAAAICFTPAAFEDTAPALPPAQAAEGLRRRRGLAKQVKQLMVWARPEQFEPRLVQDSSSSSSDGPGPPGAVERS